MFPAERVEDEVRRVLRSQSHFDLLGLPLDVRDEDTIRRAYKTLSVRIHPDKCRHPEAAEAFKQLRRACDILLDPDSRAKHLAEVQEQQRAEAPPPRRTPFTHAPYLAKGRPEPCIPTREGSADREAKRERQRRRVELQERQWKEAEERRRQHSAHRQALHKAFADPMRLVVNALRQKEEVAGIRHLDGTPPIEHCGSARPAQPAGQHASRCSSHFDCSSCSPSGSSSRSSRSKRAKRSKDKRRRKKAKKERSPGRPSLKHPPKGLLEQLRQERLQREYAERRRAQALLKSQYD